MRNLNFDFAEILIIPSKKSISALIIGVIISLVGCAASREPNSLAGCFVASVNGAFPSSRFVYATSSGSEQIDNVLRSETLRLQKSFGVSPAFSFFVEPEGYGPNALATPEILFASRDGTVLFGQRLISAIYRDEVGSTRRGGSNELNPLTPVDVRMVLAHEYAHIYQLRLPYNNSITVPMRELQADFLAAWHMQDSLTKYNGADGDNFAKSPVFGFIFYRLGDVDFGNPQHHGTYPQRLVMALEGAAYRRENPRANARQAADAGLARILPRGSKVAVQATRQWFEGNKPLIIGDD